METRAGSLVGSADFIKVDFKQLDWKESVSSFEKLKGHPAQFLAEKIEMAEKFKQARMEGFRLFQGYYFCRPIEKGRIVSAC